MVELDELERIAVEFVRKKTQSEEIYVTAVSTWHGDSWYVRGSYKGEVMHILWTVYINQEGKVYSYQLG